MGCQDYLTVAQLKTMGVGTSLTDAALALMLMGASDYLDEVIGHSFNRGLRVYYPDLLDGTTSCTVAVTATSIDFVITGGPHAGASSFAFALWPTLAQIVEAINSAGYGVLVEFLHAQWLPEQPCTNLSLRLATSVFGIENWAVLCLSQLTVTLDGGGAAMVFLPYEPASISSVTEDGSALTQGVHYYMRHLGYLERAGYGCSVSSLTCSGAFTCPPLGYWSCSYPQNVVVSFVPRSWVMVPWAKAANALVEFIKVLLASSGFLSETIGRYSYQAGGAKALALFNSLIEPLKFESGLVLGVYPGF